MSGEHATEGPGIILPHVFGWSVRPLVEIKRLMDLRAILHPSQDH
jgi:hypothetical protein